MLKLKQIAFIVVFISLNILSFAENRGIDYYYEKLSSHKKVDELGSISMSDGEVLIKGMVYDKIRIDSLYIQDGNSNAGQAKVVFLIKDIEKAFLRKNKDIKTIEVTTTDNSLLAQGKAKLMGKYFKIKVEGFFTVKDGSINCLLTNAKLGFVKMPAWVVKRFNANLNPFFKFEELGIEIRASKMVFEKDKIIMK